MIEPSLRARLDHHVIAAQARLYRAVAGGSFEITSHWARGFSGLQIPTFNIFLPLTDEGLTDESLADTAAFFSSRETVYAIELVHDRFPHGPDYLSQRRYQPLPPQPAMYRAAPLQDVPLNSAVKVERVATVPGLTALCSLLYAVFDFPLADLIKLYSTAHFKDDLKNNIRHYLAFVDEKPVSAGTIICINGAASIWNVCTLDEYRRQGIATTLLQRMLNDATESGYELTMLYATPLAYHLFNKMGFGLFAQRQWFLPPELNYEEE
ncbi:MAG: GNAT family N-acetyltransferase [Anaerolineae bacterium]|nr:GNAT family N-acetyltransferase [Anaerolineae bacterium]